MCKNDIYINYLRHHGILGQRWGKKNGPPYPLGSSDHSASERKAGWRKSLDKQEKSSHTKNSNVSKGSDNSERDGFHLTDKQKKALKIGAAAVAASLAAYGTYKLAQSGKLNDLAAIGKAKVDAMLGKKAGSAEFGSQKANDLLGKKASETVGGIKKLAKPETLEETLRNVNPNRGNPLYKNNCTYCSVTTYLRSIGYEVTARDTGGEQQILGGVIENCFKGSKVTDGSAVKFGRSRQDAAEMLIKKFGNNASGVCSVQLKNGGGHAFNWSIKEGIVKFFDGQDATSPINNSNLIDRWWHKINPNDSLTIARLDNAEIIEEALKKVVQ